MLVLKPVFIGHHMKHKSAESKFKSRCFISIIIKVQSYCYIGKGENDTVWTCVVPCIVWHFLALRSTLTSEVALKDSHGHMKSG